MYKCKADILKDFHELELTEFGDFKIKDELVKEYEIIDFHCHLYDGVKGFLPKIFRKKSIDFGASFFDLSCYPISLKYFDFHKELFTAYPEKLMSIDGLKFAYEMSGLGGFISAIRKSTPERMLRDMRLNNISRALVLQINTLGWDSSEDMKSVISNYKEFITFGSIHPYENKIKDKINKNISYGVKGWKIAPHIIDIDIDNNKTINLIQQLWETKLPIISCSGLAFPKDMLHKIPIKMRRNIETQNINRFYNLLKAVPNMVFIFSHGGIYQTNEVIELVKLYPNTYVEISTQPPEKIKQLIMEVGSERILYGTDYPAFNHAFSIVSVLRATNRDEDRKNIFYKNAKQLLKI